MFAGNPGPAAEYADRALAIEEATEPVAIMALHIRGDSRIALGDPGGIDDLRRGAAIARRRLARSRRSSPPTATSPIASGRSTVRRLRSQRLDDGERAGRPPRRLQPGVVEQGRRAGAAVRARPVGRDAHARRAAGQRRAAWTSRWWWRSTSGPRWSICGGGSRSATSRGSWREPARSRSSRCSRPRWPSPPRRRCGGRCGRGRGARGGVRDRHPGQGRDVPVGVAAVAVARLALAAGVPEVADDLVARSEPVTMRDELFVDTAAAVVREAGVRSSPRSGPISNGAGTPTATSTRRRTRRSRSVARRTTPRRRREAGRCSRGSGSPGNAWDTSAPWIPKKRHSSRSRRRPASSPAARARTSRPWRPAPRRTSSGSWCSWSARSPRTS